MSYSFGAFYIPDRMMGGIERYIENGIKPGGFLSAIISNDLRGAVAAADNENQANLPAYVAYFYNRAPASSWGSPENMAAWIKLKQEAA